MSKRKLPPIRIRVDTPEEEAETLRALEERMNALRARESSLQARLAKLEEERDRVDELEKKERELSNANDIMANHTVIPVATAADADAARKHGKHFPYFPDDGLNLDFQESMKNLQKMSLVLWILLYDRDCLPWVIAAMHLVGMARWMYLINKRGDTYILVKAEQ